jgi:hypothetical protein
MRHVRSYKELFESQTELSQEQVKWLNKFTSRGIWELNPQTGLVDVDGDFDCTNKGLPNFRGIRFGEVSGDFHCGYNQLTTLEGAPRSVGGDFFCYSNRLTSLEGVPQKVGGRFDCDDNHLTSLEGAPQTVKGSFSCDDNQLTSLVGAPQTVGGHFFCNDNGLTSLEGAPQTVKGSFNCEGNPASESTLYSIFALMEKGMDYQQALEQYWPKMGDEDKALMYKQMPNLPLEDARKYKALATYAKIKGYL